jgi:hypothetical protein
MVETCESFFGVITFETIHISLVSPYGDVNKAVIDKTSLVSQLRRPFVTSSQPIREQLYFLCNVYNIVDGIMISTNPNMRGGPPPASPITSR